MNDSVEEDIIESEKFNLYFLETKRDELLKSFGGRQCKSDISNEHKKIDDSRILYSWQVSPGRIKDLIVDDPPKKLPGPYLPDNCYNQPVDFELKPLNGLGTNKATQIGGRFYNDLLRADTAIMSGLIA